jgi:hypothetical protein
MTTEGIEAIFLETHNWGKAAKFFQDLGFELEFRHRPQLRSAPQRQRAVRIHRRDSRGPPTGHAGCHESHRRRGVHCGPKGRGGVAVFRHTLRNPGNDRPRSRRPNLDIAGSGQERIMTAGPESTAARVADTWPYSSTSVRPIRKRLERFCNAGGPPTMRTRTCRLFGVRYTTWIGGPVAMCIGGAASISEIVTSCCRPTDTRS